MPSNPRAPRTHLTVELLESRLVPSSTPTTVLQDFDSTAVGKLPSGWSQWSNTGVSSFLVENSYSLSAPNGLGSSGTSSVTARTWLATQEPADVQVSAAVYLDSLIPIQVLARGSNLNSTSPTYYAVWIRSGLYAQLVRVVNGTSTTLGDIVSANSFESKWAQVTLSVSGTQIAVQIYRSDTQQYLTSSGKWQSNPAWAITVIDGTISGGGYTGLGRSAGVAGTVPLDDFSVTPTTSTSATGGTVQQTFDSTPVGKLPSGWSQWSTTGANSFLVSAAFPYSGSGGLASSGSSSLSACTWLAAGQPADVQVSADIYLNSLIPLKILARGSNLNSTSPTYYALAIRRGLYAQLYAVVNGQSMSLGDVTSASWFDSHWVQVTLSTSGTQISAKIYRPDTEQYLNSSGQWQSTQAWAITCSDTTISGSGFTGLARPSGLAGTVYVDNFMVTPENNSTSTSTWTPTSVTIPQHYPWIRIAELAYSGMTLGSFEDQLLANSVDLVVTSVNSLGSAISSVAPKTPQLAYINYTSLYGSLLTDWDTYAAQHGLSEESAFYHVTQPTPFSGNSPSSQPVDWFWSVLMGGQTAQFTDLTTQAYTTSYGPITLGGIGQSLYLGYTDPYCEINFNLTSGASAGWSAVLEYPTAVDSYGNPTTWSTLKLNTDGTDGLKRSGEITFDPPSNWKAISLNGTPDYYYIRIRTVRSGTAPRVKTVLGQDYVNAKGGTSGVIPVFDYAADLNHDGYLNNAEYAVACSIGDYARFAYQSRLFYGSYGQMRFATNPASSGFVAWAVVYSENYLTAHPTASGLFVDNSSGDSQITAGEVKESVSNYSTAYGALLSAVTKAVAPKWLMVNSAGGGSQANPGVAVTTAYYDEFGLRPLSGDWEVFENLAAQVAQWSSLENPAPYAILDSLPTGGSPTDPRTQIATLAEYYLLANPTRTFLDFYGGYAPATSWTQHWCQAVTYDVGTPTGSWSLLTSGADPSNPRYSYRIYQRTYTNALILYKPLSSANNGGSVGTIAPNTATYQKLNGTYRQLNANGTLGPKITGISLCNGQGAILIKV